MYISAFLHKDELFEITNRWLSNRLEPDDALEITRIITYDSFVAWERLLLFIKELNKFLPNLVHFKKIDTKKELKDFICNGATIQTDRSRQLISRYRNSPELYYIGAPIKALAFHDEGDQITAMCRFKRVKRIAEKASRYALLHITDQVRDTATQLALKNGSDPITFPKFLAQAEKAHLAQIRNQGLSLPAPIMTIKDVLGLKIIKNGVAEDFLEKQITRIPGATIIEKEIHSGNYNAIHYVVELTIDFDYMIERFKGQRQESAYRYRGLPASLSDDFQQFLRSGSVTVQVDLIFTSLDELIESEIGRSMHETHIFKQRQQQKGFSNIPINIEYIIEYLIAVGMSPTTHIEELPIKVWGRYLPDALSYNVRKLYNLPEYSIIDY
jgi:hypothetical protein